jgi:hypothetical protein
MVEFIANIGIQIIYAHMLKALFNNLLFAYHLIIKNVTSAQILITENALLQEILKTFVTL